MPNQMMRQIMIENFQDSLRLVRHLMNFSVEDFAAALGVTSQTVNQLEAKKIKMSATQYLAIAALTDAYFANHEELLPKLKAVIDSDGKSYGEDYETSFRGNSLLQRWFEDFITFDDATENFPATDEFFDDEDDDSDEEDFPDEELWDLVQEYKIFLDAETLLAEDAEEFVENLTAALEAAEVKAIIPLRSIEQLQDAANQNAGLQDKISQAMLLIKRLQTSGVLQIFGEKTDPDFHDTITGVFERFKSKYSLCLITPNEKLAREILSLNDSDDEDDFEIAACFVEDGLINFYHEEEIFAEDFDEDENSAEDSSDTEIVSDAPEENSAEKKFVGWEEL